MSQKPENNSEAKDSDSEEDEDYVPTKESDDEDDENNFAGNPETEDLGCKLSQTKRQAVDDAFASLFGVPEQEPTSASDTVNKKDLTGYSKSRQKLKVKDKKKKLASKKALRKKRKFLTDLFGETQAHKILAASKLGTSSDLRQNSRPLPTIEKKTITEVKKFAGQEIEVKKVVIVDTSSGNVPPADSASQTSHSGAPTSKTKNSVGIDMY